MLWKIVVREINNELCEKLHRFWNPDKIGIFPTESVVYEKFENCSKFDNNRYSVKLPMKEYHLQVPGKHKLTLKCLCQLRKRLAKDDITLKQYDEATQLGDGIIQH